MSVASLLLDPVLTRALGAALSVVLLAGAWQKLREPEVFAAAVENYRLLPETLVPLFARLLPLVELAAGLLLLFPATVVHGGTLSIVLLQLVTAAVIANLMRGHADIDCGCGGLSQQPLSWGLVARNAVLFGMAIVAMHDEAGRDFVWIDYLTLLGVVLAVLGLYVSANQLMANAPRALSVRH